ncbi:hypothetical protein S83_063863 [Arachis hypogaea]
MAAKPGSDPDFGALRELFKPHIESFDYMIDTGLETMLSHIKPVEIFDPFTSTKLRDILFYYIFQFFLFVPVSPHILALNSCNFYFSVVGFQH